MSSFDQVLSEIEARLDLPAQARRQVLLDLAADLEGLKLAALDAGLDEEAAHARSLEFADLSDEAVAALASEFAKAPRRWLERFPGAARSRGEQVALVLVTLAMLQLGTMLFASGKIMDSAGSGVWLPLGALLATVLVGATHFYRHRIVGDDRSRPTTRRARWAGWICALQLTFCLVKILSGALASSSLGANPTAFDTLGNPLQSQGMQQLLLLMQNQTAFLSFAGLGALAAGILAQRLGNSAAHMIVDEQQLRIDLHT